MRILVTGSSGFVGSHVADQLSGLGHTVCALVRPSSDTRWLGGLRGPESAIAAGSVRRFVHVSSMAALGPSVDGTPVADDAVPHPVNNYGRSKLAGERAVLDAADRIPVTVIRPPLVYGPRDRETLAFFTSIRRGTLPIMGDGNNTLSVIYVADCAAAIAAAALAAGGQRQGLRHRGRHHLPVA